MSAVVKHIFYVFPCVCVLSNRSLVIHIVGISFIYSADLNIPQKMRCSVFFLLKAPLLR